MSNTPALTKTPAEEAVFEQRKENFFADLKAKDLKETGGALHNKHLEVYAIRKANVAFIDDRLQMLPTSLIKDEQTRLILQGLVAIVRHANYTF